MQYGRVFEEQRHKVGRSEPPAESAPGSELRFCQPLGAAARGFIACKRM